MAAGGFRTFVAGEVLDEDDINDYLMQGILVFSGTAARGSAIGSPVEGQFAFLTDSNTLTFHDGSQWVEYQAGFFPAAVGSVTGSPGTGTFTDGNGFDWDYYRFTGNGSIQFTADGYADVLVLGGGASSANVTNRKAGGGAGAIRYGLQYFAAGTYAVTVGAAGSGVTNGISNGGSSSSIGSAIVAGGGSRALAFDQQVISARFDGLSGSGGAINIEQSLTGDYEGGGALGTPNNYDGISLNYTGSAVTYGVGGNSVAPVANTGSGGDFDVNGGAGSDGVVIVKVLA